MKRAAAFFLSLVLLLSVLNACRREENLPAEPEEIPTEVVFESVELPCPADTSINYFIRPAADADAVYAVGTQSLADGNVPVLLRFPRDGSPADTVPCVTSSSSSSRRRDAGRSSSRRFMRPHRRRIPRAWGSDWEGHP